MTSPIPFNRPLPGQTALLILLAVMAFGTFAMAGPRSALLLLTGLGFGLVLEGFRFGFAGPWRQMIAERDARGLVAQFFAIALFALVAFPLLAQAPDELSAAHAPVGVAMVMAAFVFGIAMQVVMGCGSGVLVNAGSGNLIALLALPGFVLGSFAGSLHLAWWTSLGTLPVLSLQGLFGAGTGLTLTLAGLSVLAVVALSRAVPGKRLPVARLWWAALLIAALAVINLLVSGQSWGVVYGLGLWGAKIAEAGGMEVATTAFWSADANAERLQQSLLTDVTSLTNIGMMAGAFVVMQWRRSRNNGQADAQVSLPGQSRWLVMLLAGIVLGYSARVAFGCNVGAYFSGIATGSLHGWVWFAAAFAGAGVGIRLRSRLFTPADKMSSASEPALWRGRPVISASALVLIGVLLLLDYYQAVPINPFAAPPPAAYGSGLAPQGAHCTNF